MIVGAICRVDCGIAIIMYSCIHGKFKRATVSYFIDVSFSVSDLLRQLKGMTPIGCILVTRNYDLHRYDKL